MRKYILVLMIMTVVGGGLTVYLLFQPNLVVFINNETDEEITGLTLTYDEVKSDITVPSVQPGEDESIEISPSEQAKDSFTEGSLVLQYEDNSGETHSETVFEHFELGSMGDAEVTITDKNEQGVFTINIDEEVNKPELDD